MLLKNNYGTKNIDFPPNSPPALCNPNRGLFVKYLNLTKHASMNVNECFHACSLTFCILCFCKSKMYNKTLYTTKKRKVKMDDSSNSKSQNPFILRKKVGLFFNDSANDMTLIFTLPNVSLKGN